MDRFQDKTVVITGGSSGIGLAAARAFRDEGARVAITGRDAQRLAEAGRQLGPEVLTLVADQTDPTALDRLAKALAEGFGRVDVLFANAGSVAPAPLAAMDREHVRALFSNNVEGPLFTVQRLVPLMAAGSAVVFTTSILDRLGLPGMGAYAASKAALRSLTRSLAAELKDLGIRVNAVSPGPIDTPIHRRMGLGEAQLAALAEQVQASVPLGRFGQAEEVVGAVTFLASDQASYLTGEELTVAGGWGSL